MMIVKQIAKNLFICSSPYLLNSYGNRFTFYSRIIQGRQGVCVSPTLFDIPMPVMKGLCVKLNQKGLVCSFCEINPVFCDILIVWVGCPAQDIDVFPLGERAVHDSAAGELQGR